MVKTPIVKDGYPFIGLAAAVAALLLATGHYYWSVFPVVITLFFAFFFRNPHREVMADDSLLLAPADGRVMSITELFDDEFLGEEAIKVVIFLSVFDVHINRSPIRGEIKYQRYTCGGFRPAFEKKASFENERHAIGVENEGLKVLVIQVAGLLARRIVSWVTVGHHLTQGDRYGMIKFASSTELIVPKAKVEIFAKKGQHVVGGETVIGRIVK